MDPPAPGSPARADVQRALAYPFAIPRWPYLLVAGRTYRLRRFSLKDPLSSEVVLGGLAVRARDVLPPSTGPAAAEELVPVVAAGSNAAPRHLARKLAAAGDGAVTFCTSGTLADVCAVYSAHISRYGSVPVTLAASPGARACLACLFLPRSLLGLLHASEAVGRNYGFYRLAGATLELAGSAQPAGHSRVHEPYAYLSLRGVLLLDGHPRRSSGAVVDGCDYRALSQRQVQAALMRLLGAPGDIADFVASSIDDAAQRAARNDWLGENASRPVELVGARRIE